MQHQSYSGPLPPSVEMDRYNQIIPNGSERIMAMAEKEQAARHKFNNISLDIEKRGQKYGLFVIIVFGFFSGYLTYSGYPYLGTSLMGAGMVSLVIAFIKGRSK